MTDTSQETVKDKPGFATIARIKLRELQALLAAKGCIEGAEIIEGWLK